MSEYSPVAARQRELAHGFEVNQLVGRWMAGAGTGVTAAPPRLPCSLLAMETWGLRVPILWSPPSGLRSVRTQQHPWALGSGYQWDGHAVLPPR